ncbi:MAG: bifunctional UDP-N-acetylglucosamine diphosphorylase/glucosamine-1-phosphate N-acetyltransferase GlmU [Candidatus Schekmanbacteria bacterium]|nr:bifunctional UDP-N-acetylglucosamine diphosphorylase/glucosamine-1-phosphate N-acetyltransferase GlmU [Candidatus Schekmanbacteria bacterium]
MNDLVIVILAAGQGTRMRSSKAKVLHPLAGAPMLSYVLDTAQSLQPKEVLVVTGYQGDQVRAALSDYPVKFVHQAQQLGTGHALLQTQAELAGFKGKLLVLNGDTPLLTVQTLNNLLTAHQDNALTMLTAVLPDAAGYGRVLRNGQGKAVGIVEQKDTTPEQAAIREIATGIYCFTCPLIFSWLMQINCNNAQGEYYLPDVVVLCHKQGLPMGAQTVSEINEIQGINDRSQLAQAEVVIRERINNHWMRRGVSMINPAVTYIGKQVVLGRDSLIYPQTIIEGRSRIGEGCTVGPNCHIVDSEIDDNVLVRASCVITESKVGSGAKIGPFSHLRPQAVLEENAHVGNFVEIKKSTVGKGSKVNHLTYIGDTQIGKGVNIGAGTITCNYDGVNKHKTIIDDGVFIGSDTQLVAPVHVGENAWIAAGSTITKDVPPEALAISRVHQTHKKNWVRRRKG